VAQRVPEVKVPDFFLFSHYFEVILELFELFLSYLKKNYTGICKNKHSLNFNACTVMSAET
jgi:hypothetical protein